MAHTPDNNFSFIYTSYYKKSFFFAKSYVHDDLAAEEIASESLIKLWERMKSEKIDYTIPLLLAIIKNKALDYLKHEEVKRSAFENIADWQSQDLHLRISSLEACNPEEIFSSEVEEIIQDTLQKLPAKTTEIFVLSRYDSKSNKEIAQEVNLSEKSVEYHISKALKALRIALTDYLPLFYFICS